MTVPYCGNISMSYIVAVFLTEEAVCFIVSTETQREVFH